MSRTRMGVAMLLALGVAGCDRAAGTRADGTFAAAPLPAAIPAADAFAGAAVCAQCHAEVSRAWEGSTHGTAGGRPSPETVVAPFDGRAILFADAQVLPSVDGGGRYLFVISWRSQAPDTFEVVGVVGRGHMLGGGTQGFFSEMPDGTLRFLPFDWSVTEGRWFCNARRPEVGRWRPITSAMELSECADWTPQRAMGSLDRFANCQQCHGSGIVGRFDPEADGYRTQYATLQVDCEACHGPLAEHVRLARAGAEGAGLAVEALAVLSKDASLATCFQCHATKLDLANGYVPGAKFDEHFSRLLPILTDRPYTADQRIRGFGYQLPHLSSVCYLDGSMTCTSCHDPHTQEYRDEFGTSLASPFDDGQCLGCHASLAEDPSAHTQHLPGSDGSRCVSCHMPYLQHPAIGDEITYGRSDHTIPTPRPGEDARLAIESPCATCHGDRTEEELDADVRELWGEPRPRRPLIQALVDGDQIRDRRTAAERLLRPDVVDPMGQMTALSRFVLTFVTPDEVAMNATEEQRLRALATEGDLDVRALALSALHLARGDAPEIRAFLTQTLERSEREEVGLRARWVRALMYQADVARFRRNERAAQRVLTRVLELAPNDAAALQNLGESLSAAGDNTAGVDALRRSVAADPERTFARIELALALDREGERALGIRELEEAVARNPWEPVALLRLGELRARDGDLEGAQEALEQALHQDPSLAAARYLLAQVHANQGNTSRALEELRETLVFDPAYEPAETMLRQLEGR